jgi:hypothetical protein
VTGYGDGDAAIGRYARDRFGRKPFHTQPVIVPAEGDPVVADLRREVDLSTLERLIEQYPHEALELLINRNRRTLQEPPRRP